MTSYSKIVEDELGIEDKFINSRLITIKEKLLDACYEAKKQGDFVERPEYFAINKCIHLASSVALLGSGEGKLDNTLVKLKNESDLKDLDPTTVVTVATLYYLMQRVEPEFNSEEKELMDAMRQRFNKCNWMIGTIAMRNLGISTTSVD